MRRGEEEKIRRKGEKVYEKKREEQKKRCEK